MENPIATMQSTVQSHWYRKVIWSSLEILAYSNGSNFASFVEPGPRTGNMELQHLHEYTMLVIGKNMRIIDVHACSSLQPLACIEVTFVGILMMMIIFAGLCVICLFTNGETKCIVVIGTSKQKGERLACKCLFELQISRKELPICWFDGLEDYHVLYIAALKVCLLLMLMAGNGAILVVHALSLTFELEENLHVFDFVLKVKLEDKFLFEGEELL